MFTTTVTLKASRINAFAVAAYENAIADAGMRYDVTRKAGWLRDTTTFVVTGTPEQIAAAVESGVRLQSAL